MKNKIEIIKQVDIFLKDKLNHSLEWSVCGQYWSSDNIRKRLITLYQYSELFIKDNTTNKTYIVSIEDNKIIFKDCTND